MTTPMLTVERCCAALGYIDRHGALQVEACRKFLQRAEARGQIVARKRGRRNLYHVDDVRALTPAKVIR